jgi:hypothetical protein
MTKSTAVSRIVKTLGLLVAILAVIGFSFVAYRRISKAHELKQREQEATLLISRNLHVPAAGITCEVVVIDDYMNYYSVYFKASGFATSDILKNGLKDYNKDSQERESLRLHRTGIRELKRLKWGPLEKYRLCSEYVGVWERDYLVYLAVCGDGVDGYYENRYSEEPGPGPFK